MKKEMKLIFSDGKIYLALLVMLLCFNGYSIPIWIEIWDWDFAYRESALQLTIGGIFFGGIMLLMPFLASIPAAPLQVEEIRTLFAEQRIFKSSVAQYAKGKLIAAFLSGAIVAGGAFAAQAVLWNIIAKPCDVNIYDYLVIDFADGCIYNSWQYILCGLPIYIWMTLMIAFSGGIWAIVGVTTAVYVRDKLMVLVIPSCIYYLWMSGLPHAVFGRTFPFPASLYNDSLTWALAGKAFLVYAVLAGVSVFLYIRKLWEVACNG